MNSKRVLQTYLLVALGVFAGNVYGDWERPKDGERGPSLEGGRATSRTVVVGRAFARAVTWPLALLTTSKAMEYRLLSVPAGLAARLLRRFE